MGEIEAVDMETGEFFRDTDWDKLAVETGLAVTKLVRTAGNSRSHRFCNWLIVYSGKLGRRIDGDE